MLKMKLLKIAAWGEANFMPVNLNPFYDTSYEINQITWICSNFVSAQKNAYASEI